MVFNSFFHHTPKKQDEKKLLKAATLKIIFKMQQKNRYRFFQKNAAACDKYIFHVCILISIENFICIRKFSEKFILSLLFLFIGREQRKLHEMLKLQFQNE
jgi:hypothetical protein